MPKRSTKKHPPRPEAKPIDPDQALLKMVQAGKVLGMHEASARRLAAEGLIPSLRIGRAVRVPKKELMRLIEEGKFAKPGKVKAAR